LIVADASILTDFLLGRPQALDALQRELAGREQEPLHAPELVEPETLNALRRLAISGSITDQRASEASPTRGSSATRTRHCARASETCDTTSPPTTPPTWRSPRRSDDPVLLTGDGGLAARARNSLGSDRVRHVE